MSRGLGRFLLFLGSGLLLDDILGKEPHRSPRTSVLLLLMGSGIFLGSRKEGQP
jgi:hypothetical protein